MARSHHRKKHKAHVQQFRHRGDMSTPRARGNAALTIAAIGAIVGFLMCYFISDGQLGWGAVGLAVGALAGFLTGRNIDRNK
jgi:uncharacterized protein YcfJ